MWYSLCYSLFQVIRHEMRVASISKLTIAVELVIVFLFTALWNLYVYYILLVKIFHSFWTVKELSFVAGGQGMFLVYKMLVGLFMCEFMYICRLTSICIYSLPCFPYCTLAGVFWRFLLLRITIYRLIDETKHHILKSAHPSGLSANRGFFGCRLGSQAGNIIAIDVCISSICYNILNLPDLMSSKVNMQFLSLLHKGYPCRKYGIEEPPKCIFLRW